MTTDTQQANNYELTSDPVHAPVYLIYSQNNPHAVGAERHDALVHCFCRSVWGAKAALKTLAMDNLSQVEPESKQESPEWGGTDLSGRNGYVARYVEPGPNPQQIEIIKCTPAGWVSGETFKVSTKFWIVPVGEFKPRSKKNSNRTVDINKDTESDTSVEEPDARYEAPKRDVSRDNWDMHDILMNQIRTFKSKKVSTKSIPPPPPPVPSREWLQGVINEANQKRSCMKTADAATQQRRSNSVPALRHGTDIPSSQLTFKNESRYDYEVAPCLKSHIPPPPVAWRGATFFETDADTDSDWSESDVTSPPDYECIPPPPPPLPVDLNINYSSDSDTSDDDDTDIKSYIVHGDSDSDEDIQTDSSDPDQTTDGWDVNFKVEEFESDEEDYDEEGPLLRRRFPLVRRLVYGYGDIDETL